jgi:hypothetical protein
LNIGGLGVGCDATASLPRAEAALYAARMPARERLDPGCVRIASAPPWSSHPAFRVARSGLRCGPCIGGAAPWLCVSIVEE